MKSCDNCKQVNAVKGVSVGCNKFWKTYTENVHGVMCTIVEHKDFELSDGVCEEWELDDKNKE